MAWLQSKLGEALKGGESHLCDQEASPSRADWQDFHWTGSGATSSVGVLPGGEKGLETLMHRTPRPANVLLGTSLNSLIRWLSYSCFVDKKTKVQEHKVLSYLRSQFKWLFNWVLNQVLSNITVSFFCFCCWFILGCQWGEMFSSGCMLLRAGEKLSRERGCRRIAERGCFFWCLCAKLLQSHLTLCDPMDCSPPGFYVHGILQARILEWVAMLSSRGSSWLRGWTHVSHISCIGKWVLYP